MIENKNIFITGGAGFIASHIIEKLIDNNRITIYDNCERNALKLCPFKDHENLTFIRGNVLDTKVLKDAVESSSATVFLHMAAIAGVKNVVDHPAKTFSVNLFGTYNILEAVKGKDIDILIDFSTSEVYGPDAENVDENSNTVQGPITEPRWSYAISKLSSELLSFSYHKEFNIPVCSVRPFNVYGPRQVGGGAIRNFLINSVKGDGLTIHGDGSAIRAWCYVSDFIEGIFAMIERKEAIGHIFNIGNPSASVSTKELAEKIIKHSGSSSKIVFKDIDYPDVKNRVPVVDKANKILGYTPKIDIDEGIRLSLEWFKDNVDKLD
ncbi:MAG: NAD-dependent epimerase/dehydratase family protein [Candidatus Woesearchaeota archaeon]